MICGLGPRQSKVALIQAVQLKGNNVSNVKSLIIGALAVGVVVFGYVYYQNQSNTVQITLPTVKVQ
jgi:predicted negative regulator of RcsB-dependent stress response